MSSSTDTTPSATPSTPTPPVATPRWNLVIGRFATTIGKTLEEVTATLLAHAVDAPTDDALLTVGSPADLSDADWAGLFTAVKRPQLNRAVRELRNDVAPAAPVGASATPNPPAIPVTAATTAPAMVGLLNLDDASFMAALVVGTNLNGGITAEDAVSAVRVGMADATGLFDVPDRMVESIEAYCESMDTPAGDGVYKLVNTINTRKYAEVLAPMGLTGTTVVTAARRKTFVERLRTTLWPALRSFQAAIKGWTDAWTAQASNPAMLNQIMLTAVTGGGLGALLPQINATPDVAPLRDAHKELVRGVNKLFLGLYRVPVARALAFDAMRIISQIKDPAIAAAAGKTNPEEFVRALNIGVTEHALRTERTLAQYTLNALRMDSIADAQLPAFAAQLALMGASVDWDTLGTAAVSVPAPKSSSSVKYRPYNG